MLPILELDFAALCGLEYGDFYGADRVRIVAHTHGFDAGKLPHIGTVDHYLKGQLAQGFARRPLQTPLLICHAATIDLVMLHICARREVRLPWLCKSTGWLESGRTRVPPQATPYAWWNGEQLTRLHPLPVGESPRVPRVEDFGNPFGLVSEQVPLKQWKSLRIDISNTDYSPVPLEEIETISLGKREFKLKHAYFRVEEEAW